MRTELGGGRAKAVLIAGPTASGKSAFALAMARAKNGVVINADSMQVYRQMRVLTARPTLTDEALVSHRLYGHVSAAEPYSVARWLLEVEREIAAAEAAGQLPVIVGGTGLYFKALLEGLSPVPAIPEEIRVHWRASATRMGAAGLHSELQRRDPETAAKLRPSDAQRLVRALEVIEATGRPLAEWQKIKGRPVLAADAVARIVIARPRAEIDANISHRFVRMLEEGALDEADAMLALGLSPELPAMRALGLRPLIEYLTHRTTRAAAIAAATQETRQYVKRQLTWLRRYMIAWNWLDATEMKMEMDQGFPIVDFDD